MRSARVVSFAFVVIALGACRGGASAPDARLGSDPRPKAMASASASTDASDGGAPPDAASLPSDLPKLAVVLDDPRLAAAREFDRAHDGASAAKAIEDALRAQPAPTAAEECAWRYVIGRMQSAAGASVEAAAAFDRVAGLGPNAASDAGAAPTCALASYASLRSAQAYLRAGRADDAIARVKNVGDEIAARDETKLLLAEALSTKGDRAAAVAIWRAVIGATPSGAHWVETATRLANALLDGVDGPPASHAREAFDLTTRVVVEAPKLADSSGASGPQGARARAFALLKANGGATTDALSIGERARQAQAWLDAGEGPKALTATDAILASMPKPLKPSPEACGVTTTRAQATTRAKGVPADAWGEAIAACDGDDRLVTALYNGGKASASAHRFDEAIARFTKVEQQFPKHRLADDARFHAALAAQDNGDEPRFVTLMSSVPDLYPDGDMKIEALFRVAFLRFARAEYEAAKAPLDRSIAIDGSDQFWGTAGRASYFRARVAQLTGDAADAKKRYAGVIADHPLAYSMTQAYARLAALDPALARSTLATSSARAVTEGAATFFSREYPELRSAAMEQATRLLEVGEIETARRELYAAGMLGEKAEIELVWASAYLFDRAGAPEIGHSFARARLQDFLAHYPVGRWKVAWEIAFPRAFGTIVTKATETTGVPAPLTWAIMREESGFHADIKSHANAIGLMQLLVSTAHEVAKGTGLPSDEAALKRPDVSIPLGAKLLATLRRSFATNPALAIAAYNSGTGSVRRWLDARGASDFDVWVEQIPYDETRGYVKRVLASQAAYAFLYARPALDEVLAIPTQVRRPGG